MLGDSNVRSVGVLAAWCESESHLLELDPCVDLYLSAGQHRRLCEYLVSSSGVHDEGGLARQVDSSADQISLTAAEISQRSVDLLLREYYQMVQAQQRTGTHADGSDSFGQQAFLLLCPAGPECCDVKHIVAGLAYVAQTTATAVVLLACILVPVWLAGIRLLLQEQQLLLAVALGVAGLSVLLLSDAKHRVTTLGRQKAKLSAVTPTNLQQMLDSGPTGRELSALRQASKTATTPNKVLHQQPASLQPPGPAPVPSAGPSSSGMSFFSLLPQVSALQAALGVSSTETPTSKGALAAEVQHLADVLGLHLSQDMLATPAAMTATLAQLKTHVGI